MGYFVPEKSLDNLKLYKYQSEDRSLLSNYVLRPYWRWFSQIFPLWMAPNLVTLCGLFFIIINVITTLYYDPTLTQESPRWTYFSYGIGLFMYQTFDACDGMHARRTGQSGPLGELFDHCIDSLNTTLSLFPFWSTTGMGFSYSFIFSQFLCLCNFYLSTWEEFHTHKLFLSEFSGPVEGIIILVVSFFITGIWGTEAVWHKPLLKVNENLTIETVHIMLTFSGLAVCFNIFTALQNVKQFYEEKGKTNNESKETIQLEISDAIHGLLPFFGFFLSVFSVVVIEPRFIGLPFILSTGLIMAFVVGRIIVNNLTLQLFPEHNVPTYIPLCQILIFEFCKHFLNFDSDEVIFAITWLGCGLSAGIHFMFINEIIYDFTNYLDVYALSIKHPKKV
ncbi:cholinephosphotransferase 1 [Monosporozyma unispora]|nr:hypothetical protein C6P44_001301 [Kazachstania unispora]